MKKRPSPLKLCIFCYRNDTEVSFSKEHIFPQCIGGTIYITEVCSECNSSLGVHIDNEILKLPEILDALEELKITHNRDGIIKSNYNISAQSEDIEFRFKSKNDKYEMVPLKQSDGSLIIPEENFESNLIKSIERDPDIKRLGITKKQLDLEINKFKEDYESLKPGELLHSSILGRSVIKRRDNLKIQISPKTKANVERLVVKIFFEFFYLYGGPFIFERSSEFNPLIEFIDKGVNRNAFYVNRLKSKSDKFEPVHSVTFIFDELVPRVTITFFGKIVYKIVYPIHSDCFWSDFENRYNLKDIRGIHFEQDFEEKLKKFWLLFKGGSRKFMGSI